MRVIVIILIWSVGISILVSDKLYAQTNASSKDEAVITQQKIDSLRSLAEYDYYVEKAKDKNWLELTWDQFWKSISNLFNTTLNHAYTTIFYIIGFLGLAFLIFSIAKTQGINVFGRGNKKLSIEIEELRDIDNEEEFSGKLTSEEEIKNWRKAIQILYLKSLWLLHKDGYIHLEKYKTNTDYINEIKTISIQSKFKKLVNYFDWIWYGDHRINEEEYRVVKHDFENFYALLNQSS